MLDYTDFKAHTRQRELDHTDHTDHTDQGYICPGISKSPSWESISRVRGAERFDNSWQQYHLSCGKLWDRKQSCGNISLQAACDTMQTYVHTRYFDHVAVTKRKQKKWEEKNDVRT